jgi:hypothetical protein
MKTSQKTTPLAELWLGALRPDRMPRPFTSRTIRQKSWQVRLIAVIAGRFSAVAIQNRA